MNTQQIYILIYGEETPENKVLALALKFLIIKSVLVHASITLIYKKNKYI